MVALVRAALHCRMGSVKPLEIGALIFCVSRSIHLAHGKARFDMRNGLTCQRGCLHRSFERAYYAMLSRALPCHKWETWDAIP